jgi:outer membrane lipoprotein SlyB
MTHRFASCASIVTGSVLAAMLGACTNPTLPSSTVGAYPAYPAPAGAPVALEYGRVTNIESFQGATTTSRGANVPGAIIGAVAGAVVGNQVGRTIGSGARDAATVLGGVGGAAVGSQVGRSETVVAATPAYRITVQTDQGAMRVYDVPGTGDLRIGDRVRIQNGVIYHF